MSVIGNARLPAGMAGILQVKKDGYPLDMEGFGPCDKFLIRAVIDNLTLVREEPPSADRRPTINFQMKVNESIPSCRY